MLYRFSLKGRGIATDWSAFHLGYKGNIGSNKCVKATNLEMNCRRKLRWQEGREGTKVTMEKEYTLVVSVVLECFMHEIQPLNIFKIMVLKIKLGEKVKIFFLHTPTVLFYFSFFFFDGIWGQHSSWVAQRLLPVVLGTMWLSGFKSKTATCKTCPFALITFQLGWGSPSLHCYFTE